MIERYVLSDIMQGQNFGQIASIEVISRIGERSVYRHDVFCSRQNRTLHPSGVNCAVLSKDYFR